MKKALTRYRDNLREIVPSMASFRLWISFV